MSAIDQVNKIKAALQDNPNVRIIAATKYFDVAKTKEIIEAGITEIGENRKDTFLEKYEAFKDYPITWHYFGVIKIPPKLSPSFIECIDYLHSLDSIDLANAINKARKNSTPLKCFVQVNLSGNANKTGLTEAKVIPFIKNLAKYEKIQVVGLMTIAPITFDDEVLAGYFDTMQDLQKEVQALSLSYAPCTELSMGMSNDYKIAIEHGATMIRIGTLLSK
ncbi:MAG: YggS family pyridoxal phosphate-dependent enzyme [Prevotella sp.]|nr:YggS family pyridoxal phosphate-dependent enzyme [Staphylococcus sp.]MCM1349948.1 YggS family pyridoxal phosphate-dependent enzyme [Prevotella sp.]